LDAGVRHVGRDDITLQALREQWLEWAQSRAGLAPRTVDDYVQRLDDRVLPILGADTKAASVTAAHLRGMMDRLSTAGYSGSSVCGCCNAVSSLFKFGIRRGHLAANPVRDWSTATGPR
jgi:site-specific recombinase XerD